jgi:hypothetical protein
MATPLNPIIQPLLFEVGFLAVSTVLGMALYRMRSERGSKGGLVQAVLAIALMVYASRKLPSTWEVWLILAPAAAFFAVIGQLAAAGYKATRKPSMEEQIEQLTGEHIEWGDLRPDRGIDHMRERNRRHDR